jgi:two-component system response regulator YesN
MYKVIIADDEVAVRERITAYLQKRKDDFTLLGSFENGYDALVSGVSQEPDLIITDIKMPYISGIELIRDAKVELPLLQSIIISGYDSFDFAKQAISLGVVAYISKPVSYDELSAALDKAKAALDQRVVVDNSWQSLKMKEESTSRIIQEFDLQHLMTTKVPSANFSSKLKEDGIDLTGAYQMVFIFDSDASLDGVSPELKEKTDAFLGDSFSSDFLTGSGFVFYPFSLADQFCLLGVASEKPSKEDLSFRFSALLAKMKVSGLLSCSIGVSEIGVQSEEISYRKLYRHAKASLEYRTALGIGMILFYEDVHPAEVSEANQAAKIDENEYKEIAYEVSYGDKEEAKDRVKALVEMISSPRFKDSYYFILTTLTDSLLKSCLSLSDFYIGLGMNHLELLNTISGLKNKSEVCAFFAQTID